MRLNALGRFTLVCSLASSGLLAQPFLYESGHGDAGVSFANGELVFSAQLAPGAVVDGRTITAPGGEAFAFADVIIAVPASTETTVPFTLAPAGITAAGQSLWILEQASQPGEPFWGIATGGLGLDWSDITFTLGAVTSPSGSGHFSLWQSGTFGGFNFFMSTAQPGSTVNAGSGGPNTLVMVPASHDHYNWGFTEPGLWQVEITARGTHPTHGEVETTETLTFQVGNPPPVVPEPAGLGLLAAVGAGIAAWRQRTTLR